ncbi:MAG TPA: hypothetical protein VIW07_13310 [Candidatus Udaeobacter sp.]|jgi:hypothetical protein
MLITPSHYWADWDPAAYPPNILRRDTRIYWEPQKSGTVGCCVGTFVGENPGGAQSIFGLSFVGYSPVEHKSHSGDPTLRLLFDVWHESARLGRVQPQPDDYIEVLNTYYFRNPKSGAALNAWLSCSGSTLYFPSPRLSSRFVILGWGVRQNGSSHVAAMVTSLRHCMHVLIPGSDGAVTVASGAELLFPVTPAPVAPSGVLMKSKSVKPAYIANLARHFR